MKRIRKKIITWCEPDAKEMQAILDTRVRTWDEAERLLKWATFRMDHPVLSFILLVIQSKFR